MSDQREAPRHLLPEPPSDGPAITGSPEADHAVVLAFVTQLRQVFAAPSYRPPLLPTVALEVHELSYRPDVDADQLVNVLEQDAMLAAQVLRVAGSAAYGGWGSGDPSLKQAVVRLGLRNLASVVWEVAMGMRVFRSTRYAGWMEEIRVHSTVCAYLCRLLASRKGVAVETAFLCGLLADIGMAATLLVLADRPKDEPAIAPIVLDEVLRETHQEVSGMIAHLWKLPDEVRAVLANHHRGEVDGAPSPLAAIVAISEEMSRDLGHGISIGGGRCDHVTSEALGRAFDTLALPSDAWLELSRTSRTLVDSLIGDGAAERGREAAAQEAAPPPASRKVAPSRAEPQRRQARRSFWAWLLG